LSARFRVSVGISFSGRLKADEAINGIQITLSRGSHDPVGDFFQDAKNPTKGSTEGTYPSAEGVRNLEESHFHADKMQNKGSTEGTYH
jgi:hypothetical protein